MKAFSLFIALVLSSSLTAAATCTFPNSPTDIAKLYGEVGQKIEPPEVGIISGTQAYFVPILVGTDEATGKSTPVMYLPLAVKGNAPVLDKSLFNTVVTLRFYLRETSNLSARDPSYLKSSMESDLSRLVSDVERQDIVVRTVKEKSSDFSVDAAADSVLSASNDLVSRLEDYSGKRSDSVTALNKFFQTPSQPNFDAFKSSLGLVFGDVNSLNASSNNYITEMFELQSAISLCDSCDFSDRPVVPYQNASNFSSTVTSPIIEYKALIEPLYSYLTPSRLSVFYNSFAEKTTEVEAKFNVEKALQCEAFGSDYENLEQAVNTILDAQFKPYWVDQDAVAELEVKWSKLAAFVKQGDYASAKELLADVSSLAGSVIDSGFVEQQEEGVDLFSLGLVLAGLAVIFILYSQRDRFFPPKEEFDLPDLPKYA